MSFFPTDRPSILHTPSPQHPQAARVQIQGSWELVFGPGDSGYNLYYTLTEGVGSGDPELRKDFALYFWTEDEA